MKGTSSNKRFQWTDCWLLQAIVIADKGHGASYRDVVATADGLNHALLTAEEMESGLARLAVAGLVSHGDARFFATAKARETYATADDGGNVFHTRENLEKLLGAESWRADLPYPNPANTLTYTGYSREAHEAANKAWHEEARQILDSKRKK